MTNSTKLTSAVWVDRPPFDPGRPHVIGVFVGEGVGAEVVPAALDVLAILAEHTDRAFDIRTGGLIGYPAKAAFGEALSTEVIAFARAIFAENGALFCGPGGERFVYDMRRVFDLFCKFTPLQPMPQLSAAGALRPETVADVDIVAVREGSGGIYQGVWGAETAEDGRITASHRFDYTDEMVCRIVAVALATASSRRKRLHLVLKPGGIPSISTLWRDCADRMVAGSDVELIEHEIDNAAYQLIANPRQYDVILSPNMFGDVLADCGSLLLASRGLSFSGNFNDRGDGVYQTGHGAARDIAGKDVANPIGQMFSLGMMLRESFDWPAADAAIRAAVGAALQAGFCTSDVVSPGAKVVGTRAFAAEVNANLRSQLAGRRI